jgi:hypothetical protein
MGRELAKGEIGGQELFFTPIPSSQLLLHPSADINDIGPEANYAAVFG